MDRREPEDLVKGGIAAPGPVPGDQQGALAVEAEIVAADIHVDEGRAVEADRPLGLQQRREGRGQPARGGELEREKSGGIRSDALPPTELVGVILDPREIGGQYRPRQPLEQPARPRDVVGGPGEGPDTIAQIFEQHERQIAVLPGEAPGNEVRVHPVVDPLLNPEPG